MSSPEFAAHLRASSALRQIVQVSGAVLCAAGILLIAGWPIGGWQIVLVVAWTARCWLELRRYRRAYRLFRHIRCAGDGSIVLADEAHTTTDAELLPGSVLLERVGWLRLETSDGQRFAELIAGNPRKNKDWRRLQVIWRHL